jgi:O-antigen/teichoic acid export membrane protein
MRVRLSPPLAYAASVAVDKGFSIISIPLLAAYLAPASYGRLDVAISLIESVGLVMSFGMADTLARFTGHASDRNEQNRCISELLAAALVITLTLGTLLQLSAPWLSETFQISISLTAFRWGLLGATVTALIELPLIWFRLRGRAGLFFTIIGLRSALQVLSMWLVLRAGFGAGGILIANGVTMLILSCGLAAWQISETGLALSTETMRRISHYGVPLVMASLAMFALGSCNRLFLSGRVSDADIGYLGLATKLALAAPLLFQPFNLWWGARRFAVLQRPDGLKESAWAWGIGFSMLIMSALGVCLAGPVFIAVAFPVTYAGAAIYLPFVVLVCVLNELNTLCNTGTYARDNGVGVLVANGSGALVAVCGYAALAPSFGVAGVLAATVVGHVVRLAIFLKSGHELAPIPYPFGAAVAVSILAILVIATAPTAAAVVDRVVWSICGAGLVATVMVGSRLVPMPHVLPTLGRGRLADGSTL